MDALPFLGGKAAPWIHEHLNEEPIKITTIFNGNGLVNLSPTTSLDRIRWPKSHPHGYHDNETEHAPNPLPCLTFSELLHPLSNPPEQTQSPPPMGKEREAKQGSKAWSKARRAQVKQEVVRRLIWKQLVESFTGTGAQK
jgi:hypothetical protein